MMRPSLLLLVMLTAGPAMAETVVAARTIRPQETIGPADITLSDVVVPGAATDPEAVIGMEARVALYAGRPIHPSQFGQPAIIERNQMVELIYSEGALRITTSGRALERGGVGDQLRVMNSNSRNIVIAEVSETGELIVSN